MAALINSGRNAMGIVTISIITPISIQIMPTILEIILWEPQSPGQSHSRPFAEFATCGNVANQKSLMAKALVVNVGDGPSGSSTTNTFVQLMYQNPGRCG